jgi:hypothetical protein
VSVPVPVSGVPEAKSATAVERASSDGEPEQAQVAQGPEEVVNPPVVVSLWVLGRPLGELVAFGVELVAGVGLRRHVRRVVGVVTSCVRVDVGLVPWPWPLDRWLPGRGGAHGIARAGAPSTRSRDLGKVLVAYGCRGLGRCGEMDEVHLGGP